MSPKQPLWSPPVPPESAVGTGHRWLEPVSMEGEHKGIDVQAVRGTPALAPFQGTVHDVWYEPEGLGLQVDVDGANGQRVRYAHLDDVLARPGQQVGAGEQLGVVGSTGAGSTGPHLDIRLQDQRGNYHDPSPHLGWMAEMPRADKPGAGQDLEHEAWLQTPEGQAFQRQMAHEGEWADPEGLAEWLATQPQQDTIRGTSRRASRPAPPVPLIPGAELAQFGLENYQDLSNEELAVRLARAAESLPDRGRTPPWYNMARDTLQARLPQEYTPLPPDGFQRYYRPRGSTENDWSNHYYAFLDREYRDASEYHPFSGALEYVDLPSDTTGIDVVGDSHILPRRGMPAPRPWNPSPQILMPDGTIAPPVPTYNGVPGPFQSTFTPPDATWGNDAMTHIGTSLIPNGAQVQEGVNRFDLEGGNRTLYVYGGPGGNDVVGLTTVVHHPEGGIVEYMMANRDRGLLAARAARALGDAVEQNHGVISMGDLSPDGARIANAWMARARSRVPAIAPNLITGGAGMPGAALNIGGLVPEPILNWADQQLTQGRDWLGDRAQEGLSHLDQVRQDPNTPGLVRAAMGEPFQRIWPGDESPGGGQDVGAGQGENGFYPGWLPGGIYGANKWSGSSGTDVFMQRGSVVRAPFSGVVERAVGGTGLQGGGEVILRGDNGTSIRLRHVQPGLQGGRVFAGQPIGTVNDPSLDMLGPYQGMPDGFQHVDLSVNQGTDMFDPTGGGGGNIDADAWLRSTGYQGQMVGSTLGPNSGGMGGMPGGMGGGFPGMPPMMGGMPGMGDPFGGMMGMSMMGGMPGMGGFGGFGGGMPGGMGMGMPSMGGMGGFGGGMDMSSMMGGGMGGFGGGFGGGMPSYQPSYAPQQSFAAPVPAVSQDPQVSIAPLDFSKLPALTRPTDPTPWLTNWKAAPAQPPLPFDLSQIQAPPIYRDPGSGMNPMGFNPMMSPTMGTGQDGGGGDAPGYYRGYDTFDGRPVEPDDRRDIPSWLADRIDELDQLAMRSGWDLRVADPRLAASRLMRARPPVPAPFRSEWEGDLPHGADYTQRAMESSFEPFPDNPDLNNYFWQRPGDTSPDYERHRPGTGQDVGSGSDWTDYAPGASVRRNDWVGSGADTFAVAPAQAGQWQLQSQQYQIQIQQLQAQMQQVNDSYNNQLAQLQQQASIHGDDVTLQQQRNALEDAWKQQGNQLQMQLANVQMQNNALDRQLRQYELNNQFQLGMTQLQQNYLQHGDDNQLQAQLAMLQDRLQRGQQEITRQNAVDQTRAQLQLQSGQLGFNQQQLAAQTGLAQQQLGTNTALQQQQLGVNTGLHQQDARTQAALAQLQLAAQTGFQNQQLRTQTGLATQQLGVNSALAQQQLATQTGLSQQQLAAQIGMQQQQLGSTMAENAANRQAQLYQSTLRNPWLQNLAGLAPAWNAAGGPAQTGAASAQGIAALPGPGQNQTWGSVGMPGSQAPQTGRPLPPMSIGPSGAPLGNGRFPELGHPDPMMQQQQQQTPYQGNPTPQMSRPDPMMPGMGQDRSWVGTGQGEDMVNLGPFGQFPRDSAWWERVPRQYWNLLPQEAQDAIPYDTWREAGLSRNSGASSPLDRYSGMAGEPGVSDIQRVHAWRDHAPLYPGRESPITGHQAAGLEYPYLDPTQTRRQLSPRLLPEEQRIPIRPEVWGTPPGQDGVESGYMGRQLYPSEVDDLRNWPYRRTEGGGEGFALGPMGMGIGQIVNQMLNQGASPYGDTMPVPWGPGGPGRPMPMPSYNDAEVPGGGQDVGRGADMGSSSILPDGGSSGGLTPSATPDPSGVGSPDNNLSMNLSDSNQGGLNFTYQYQNPSWFNGVSNSAQAPWDVQNYRNNTTMPNLASPWDTYSGLNDPTSGYSGYGNLFQGPLQLQPPPPIQQFTLDPDPTIGSANQFLGPDPRIQNINLYGAPRLANIGVPALQFQQGYQPAALFGSPNGTPMNAVNQVTGQQTAGGFSNPLGYNYQEYARMNPFQRAAMRTQTELQGVPWEQMTDAMRYHWGQQGGPTSTPGMTRLGAQHLQADPVAMAGQNQLADTFGETGQNYWQRQNQSWMPGQYTGASLRG